MDELLELNFVAVYTYYWVVLFNLPNGMNKAIFVTSSVKKRGSASISKDCFFLLRSVYVLVQNWSQFCSSKYNKMLHFAS